MQNGYNEKFNRLYGEAIQDAYLFIDIGEVRSLSAEWIEEFNEHGPMKHYRTEHPPNGNNKKLNHNLTIKPVWKKGYIHLHTLALDNNSVCETFCDRASHGP